MKKRMKYKKNHFIFKFYLKNWHNEDNKVDVYFKNQDKIEPRNRSRIGVKKYLNSVLYEKQTSIMDNRFSTHIQELVTNLTTQHKTNLKLPIKDSLIPDFVAYLYSHNYYIREALKEIKQPSLKKYLENTGNTDILAQTLYNSFKTEFPNYWHINMDDISNHPYTLISSDFPVLFFDFEIEKPNSKILSKSPYGELIIESSDSEKLQKLIFEVTIKSNTYTITYNNITNFNYNMNVEDIENTLEIKQKVNNNTIIYCPLSYNTASFLCKKSQLLDIFTENFTSPKIRPYLLHILNSIIYLQAREQVYASNQAILNFLSGKNDCFPDNWNNFKNAFAKINPS